MRRALIVLLSLILVPLVSPPASAVDTPMTLSWQGSFAPPARGAEFLTLNGDFTSTGCSRFDDKHYGYRIGWTDQPLWDDQTNNANLGHPVGNDFMPAEDVRLRLPTTPGTYDVYAWVERYYWYTPADCSATTGGSAFMLKIGTIQVITASNTTWATTATPARGILGTSVTISATRTITWSDGFVETMPIEATRLNRCTSGAEAAIQRRDVGQLGWSTIAFAMCRSTYVDTPTMSADYRVLVTEQPPASQASVTIDRPTTTHRLAPTVASETSVLSGRTVTFTASSETLYDDGVWRPTQADTASRLEVLRPQTSGWVTVINTATAAGGLLQVRVNVTASGEYRFVTGTATSAPASMALVIPPAAPTTTTGPTVRWRTVTLPRGTCGAKKPVTLRKGHAEIRGSRGYRVDVSVLKPVSYGDVDSDGRNEVGAPVKCLIAGATSIGSWTQGLVGRVTRGNAISKVALLPSRGAGRNGYWAPWIRSVTLSPGQAVVVERTHARTDATCCPSITATTTWTYARGGFTPRPTDYRMATRMVPPRTLDVERTSLPSTCPKPGGAPA